MISSRFLKTDTTPLVSVVVVNWNGERYLRQCLDSLLAQSFLDYEIIVVDNNSADQSLALLEEDYRDGIILVKNDRNYGFAEGNNRGIAIARGAFIATLNTDACADRRWLEELVTVAASDPAIGMVASKILLVDKPDSIDSVGVNMYPDGMSRQRGHLKPNDGRYAAVEEVLVPSACAALYRTKMLDETGPFDPAFFAYCEDTDLGLRGRLAGWKAVLAPQAIVHHHYSGSAGKYSAFKAFYVERNHYWVALKTMPLGMLAQVPFFSVVRFLAQCYDALMFKRASLPQPEAPIRKRALIAAVVRAYIAMTAGIPAMLAKRNDVRAYKKISDKEVRLLFKRFRLRLSELRLDP